MTGAALQALAVPLVLGGGLLLLMLTISFRRGHGLAAALTVVILLAALAALWPAAQVIPQTVTPLLRMDGYALFFMALFLAATLATVLLSRGYLEGGRDDPEEYYLLLLTATLGAVTLAGASHFASLLLGLEILSVSLYVLIAYPEAGHPPLEAALKYLILSGAASTTMLFGMALIYAASGTLEFAALTAAAVDSYVIYSG
jgi:NADH-quinone oxidoreductase subunit N